MASVYTPEQLGIKTPTGGFQTGGWYDGRQFWDGTFSDAGVIHPGSNQTGAGQAVSAEVNAQSATQQGVAPDKFTQFLTQQNQTAASTLPKATVTTSVGSAIPNAGTGTGTGTGAGVGVTASPVPNLPDLYKNLYKDAGIDDKEAQLVEAERQFLEGRNQVSDNPYLSVSSMDRRLARLRQQYERDTAPLRNEVAMKKADIETQLNLQMKQFDINSQAAQQALSQFNTLLASGALDNAGGEDIANLTRMTGMSSSMIQSAIQAAKKAKETPPQMISFDDGVNQGFVMVDPMTGDILTTQVVAKSSAGAGGSGFNTQGFLDLIGQQSLIEQELMNIDLEVSAPQFTPQGGVGSVYTEPSSGIRYQFTQNGWVPA